MFPYSLVEAKRTYAYPIRVIITMTSPDDSSQEVEIWSGQQQDLFEKYPQRRQRTIQEIRETLAKLQQEHQLQLQQQQQSQL